MPDNKIKNKELFYDTIAHEWKSFINNKETNKRLQVIFYELLNKNELHGKNFLEVGCGLGYFSKKALKMGAIVTGVDISPKLVSICNRNIKKAKFLAASGDKLPFKNNSFDAVLCTEVIEHVQNQKKVIKELIRVLKRGGILVITTPNKNFKPLFDVLGILKIRHYHGNENWFTHGSLKRLLEKNGTRIVKEKYFNFFYPTPILDYFERYSLIKPFTINMGFYAIKNS